MGGGGGRLANDATELANASEQGSAPPLSSWSSGQQELGPPHPSKRWLTRQGLQRHWPPLIKFAALGLMTSLFKLSPICNRRRNRSSMLANWIARRLNFICDDWDGNKT